MAGLQLTQRYENPYYTYFKSNKNRDDFDYSIWETNARRGELDRYISILEKTEGTNTYQTLSDKYRFDLLDTDRKMFALENEIWGDRENVQKYEIDVWNDAIKQYEKQTLEMTPYEYNSKMIEDYSLAAIEQDNIRIANERKKSWGFWQNFGAFWGDVLDVSVFKPIEGALTQLESLGKGLLSIPNGIKSSIAGEGFDKGFRETYQTEGVGTSFSNWVEQFEINCTHMKMPDGTVNGIGAFFSTVYTSLGQMLPTIISGAIGGKLLEAAGVGAKGLQAFSYVNQAAYYLGMANGNIGEMINDPNMAGLDTWKIVLNGSLKAAAEYSVEKALSWALGGSSLLDKAVFGKAAGGISGKVVDVTTKGALKLILKSSVHEGLEEVLQEYSGYLIDSVFNQFDRTFEPRWDIQTVLTSFFAGALSSGLISSLNLIKGAISDKIQTKRELDNISKNKTDKGNTRYKLKDGEIVDTESSLGKGIQRQLRKVSYNANFENAISLYNDIMNGKYNKDVKLAASMKMYETLYAMSAIYGEVGQAKFKESLDLINSIGPVETFDYITDKKLRKQAVSANVTITQQAIVIKLMEKYKSLPSEIDFNNSKVEAVVTAKPDVEIDEDLNIDLFEKENPTSAESLKDVSKHLKKDVVVVSESPKAVIENESALYVDSFFAKNLTSQDAVYKVLAETRLIKELSDENSFMYRRHRQALDDVKRKLKNIVKEIMPTHSMSDVEAISYVLFNENYRDVIVFGATKEIMSFMDILYSIREDLNINNQIDLQTAGLIERSLQSFKERLVYYFSNIQTIATDYSDFNLFTEDDLKVIKAKRFAEDLKQKFLNNVSKYDITVEGSPTSFEIIVKNSDRNIENFIKIINIKIKSLSYVQKTMLHSYLNAGNFDVSFNYLNKCYNDVYFSNYNNSVYFSDKSIVHLVFNKMLQNNNGTLDDLSIDTVSDYISKQVIDEFGELTPDTLTKFWLDTFNQMTGSSYNIDLNFDSYNYTWKLDYSLKKNSILRKFLTTNLYDTFKVDNSPESIPYLNKSIKSTIDLFDELKIFNNDLTSLDKESLSITDLIADPSLLSESFRKELYNDYFEGTNVKIVPQMIYSKLNDMITSYSDGELAIVMNYDGSYSIYSFKYLKPLLKENYETLLTNGKVKTLKDLLKPNSLPSDILNIPLIFDIKTNDYRGGYWNGREIHLRKNSPINLTLLFHELGHAIQTYNNLYNGGDGRVAFGYIDDKGVFQEPYYSKRTIEECLKWFETMFPNVYFLLEQAYEGKELIKQKYIKTGTLFYSLLFGEQLSRGVLSVNGSRYGNDLRQHTANSICVDEKAGRIYFPDGTIVPIFINPNYKAKVSNKNNSSNASITSSNIVNIDRNGNVDSSNNFNYSETLENKLINSYLDGSNLLITNTEQGITVFANNLTSEAQYDELFGLLEKHFQTQNEPIIVKTLYGDFIFESNEDLNNLSNILLTSFPVASYSEIPIDNRYYINKKMAKNTALQYYVGKKLDQKTVDFLLNVNLYKIDQKLAHVIKEGNFNYWTVLEYVRDLSNLQSDNLTSKYTFEILNEYIFDNLHLKSLEDLNSLENNISKYYALATVLKSLNNTEELYNVNSIDRLNELYDYYMDDSTTEVLLKKTLDRFDATGIKYDEDGKIVPDSGAPLDINYGVIRQRIFQNYDGTLKSLDKIAADQKFVALRKQKGYSEGKYTLAPGESKTRSLDETVGKGSGKGKTGIGGSGDLSLTEVIADTNSERLFDIVEKSKISGDKLNEETLAMMSDIIEYINNSLYTKAKELAEKGYTYKQVQSWISKQNQKYDDKISSLSYDELVSMWNRLSSKFEKSDVDTVKTRNPKNVKRNVKSIETKINKYFNNLKRPQQAKRLFVERFSDLVELVDGKIRVKDELYFGKNVQANLPRFVELEQKIKAAWAEVRDGAFNRGQKYLTNYVNNKEKYVQERTIKERLLKENEELRRQLEKTINNLHAVKLLGETTTVEYTGEIPQEAIDLIGTTFDSTDDTNVKFLSDADEEHIITSINEFISKNKNVFDNLTNETAEKIIDFFTSSHVIGQQSPEFARRYDAKVAYSLANILSLSRDKVLQLSDISKSKIKQFLKEGASSAGTRLVVQRNILDYINPIEVVTKEIAASYGIEIDADDLKVLTSAIKHKDVKKYDEYLAKIERDTLEQLHSTKPNILDSLIKFQRIAMLSGPGTWVRNIVSNHIVTEMNKVTGTLGSLLTGGKKKLVEGQYQITGTKVSERTKSIIKKQVMDTDLYGKIADGINKYDNFKSAKYKDVDKNLAYMTARAIISRLKMDNQFSVKGMNVLNKLVMKALSDDFWVKRQTYKYMGAMIEEDIEAKKITVDSDGSINQSDLLKVFVEAFTQSSIDYMHKPNLLGKLDDIIRSKSKAAYFAWKQVAPFASAGWNWFVESLKYNPIGLGRAIIKYCILEDEIAKVEQAKAEGKKIDVPSFVQYNLRRDIGKGVIGTIGFVIGAALMAFGIAGIDDEDDKPKIKIGDTYIDITNIFGTSGIVTGMALFSPLNKWKTDEEEKNWLKQITDAFVLSLDSMFEDFFVTDFFNNFKYQDTIGEWLLQQPLSVASKFIPNIIKTFGNVIEIRKVKYDKGMLGQLERFVSSSLPGLSYAFPSVVDPYTGETKMKYKIPFLLAAINTYSPIKINQYDISDTERKALENGVTKGTLTGRYEDIGDLSIKNVNELNSYYGKLNDKELKKFYSGQVKYKVQMPNGKYKELSYRQMTPEQRNRVIDRIMNNNSKLSKIYIATTKLGYRYYASEEEFKELRKMGYKNIYKKTDKLNGLVK